MFCVLSDGLNGKSNDLIGTSDSSSMPLELIGLERLAQLIINAGGTNQMTVDSLIVRKSFEMENKDFV